jgi:putative tryptophan/tyrosine transport system substrate-binding protein
MDDAGGLLQPTKRRDFIAMLVGATAALPRLVRAQQPSSVPVIGILGDSTPEVGKLRLAGFARGLADMGFVEGRNFAIENRWASGNYDLIPNLADELVRQPVSVILASGTERLTRAAQAATKTIPIVAILAGDPVKRGLVASVTRPGGNLTVVSLFTFTANALIAKRLQLLHELSPNATIVGWLVDSNILDYQDQSHDLHAAAQALALDLKVASVARGNDLRAGFESLVQQGAGATVATGPIMFNNQFEIVGLAARKAIPIMYEWREFVEAGGLMSYGADFAEISRQAGVYVARILKGEKVGDLPVVEATKIELVVNLKTAKTLGLTVSPMILARADDVIE